MFESETCIGSKAVEFCAVEETIDVYDNIIEIVNVCKEVCDPPLAISDEVATDFAGFFSVMELNVEGRDDGVED